MSVPDEFSETCELCGNYNVNYCDCLVIDGRYYCIGCLVKKFKRLHIDKLFANIRRLVKEAEG